MGNNKLNAKILSSLGQGGSAFGITLLELMEELDNIMVLTADMSTPAGLDKFKSLHAGHFLNLGIAEQNMIGVAAGLTDEGYKVISVAQACFISTRCFEPVRQFLGYMFSRQILVGIGSGFSLTFMGNTHYALEDIALMKSIPGMIVIAPSDAIQAMKALEAAVHENSPVYIRLHGGNALPIVHENDLEFQIGKAIKLRDGKDLQLIATGSMVSVALKVAEQLLEESISVSVIDMHTIKPLDMTVLDMEVPVIVSLEEHRVIGGLGDSIASCLSRYTSHPRLLKIGVKDEFSVVGDYSYLMEQNGLSCNKILEQIKSFL